MLCVQYFLVCSSSVQSLSRVWLFATPWTAARQASLSITSSQSLIKLMSVESLMPSNHLILCCLLLLPPSIFPRIRLFSSESVLCIRWPKYWSCSFKISPFNEHSGLISFRMYWWVYGKLFMAKNRHLVLLALKIPDPNSFGHLIRNMLQGLWWAGLESIQQGSFKEHLGSACPDGRRSLRHSFAGLDSPVSGRCQPCVAVCIQGGRPLSFIGQRWFALRFASQFVLHVWGWGTQCQTHCHVDFLQKFSGEGCSAQPEVSPTPQPTWPSKLPPQDCPVSQHCLPFALSTCFCCVFLRFYVFI